VGRWTEPASAAGSYTADEQNNIDMYRSAKEATVNIMTVVYQQDFFFQVYPVKGAGSGFIITPEGQILTNGHVVRGSRQITVTLSDKKEYKARLLGIDTADDLALIQIDAGRKLTTLPLGNSDNLVVGQKVLAIGNPFGQFGGTLTTGVVSSLDRTIQAEDSSRLENMVQTDAAINPGNSGGPLLDSHGSVIGINTAILTQTNIGIGFAMPINRAKSMLEMMQQKGRITRAAPLGIRVLPVSGSLAEALSLPAGGGLLIQSVERGSAAEEAGLRGAREVGVVGNYEIGIGGDLIIEVDGQKVEGNATLTRAMSRKRGGDTLNVTVLRNGRQVKITVHLVEAPQSM
jgi:S1-C subfamily serine protease